MSSRSRILVADDDETLLHTLTWILGDKGYDVIPVRGGEHLLRHLQNERPDLLMLDIMMPKVDGLRLLEQVKADARWRDLPVLMISSMPPEEATVRSLGLGASDFIAKPFRVKELLARVAAHLRQGRALEEARREARLREAALEEARREATSRAEMVDILHEITDALQPEEIYHILARRVANVLKISRCSLVLAKSGDEIGLVVVTAENPMIRNLEIRLVRYPEIQKALSTGLPVLVSDIHTDPLYAAVREQWRHEGISVPIRSVIAVPFSLRAEQAGVFFLRTTDKDPPLSTTDLEFAENVIQTAVNALEKAYVLQTAQSDKERYQFLATVDSLTGCLNRRALMEKLEAEFGRVQRYGVSLSILMVDVDRFKTINDTFGHLTGDGVLKQLGELLRREVRTVDVVARYGGEEFVIVLPETGLDGAMSFAERIRARVARHEFPNADAPLSATVSVGVAAVPPAEIGSPEGLIALADEALYRAKNEGRNLVRS
jgi:two-component system cell cycle response regulator